jgi:GcrA cell cycle regulator
MANEELGSDTEAPENGEKVMERPLAPPARPISDVKDCLWPIGDPGEDEFGFCGEETSPGRPYCATHCAVAYIRKDRTAA